MKKIIIAILMVFTFVVLTPQAECYTRGKTHVKSYTTKSSKHVKAHSTTTHYKGAGGTRKYKKRK